MIELGDAKPAPTKEELLASLKGGLLKTIQEEIDADIDPEKLRQCLEIRKSKLYFAGNQYLILNKGVGGTIDWAPVGSPISGRAAEEAAAYDYSLNKYYGDTIKVVGLLGNRNPAVKAVADDLEDDDAVEDASQADSLKSILEGQWDIRTQHRHLVFQLCTAGTVFPYTSWNADGYQYGFTEEPVVEQQNQEIAPAGYECQQCGQRTPLNQVPMGAQCPCGAPLTPEDFRPADTAPVPVTTGTQKYENGQVELHLYTPLEVTVPFYSRNLKRAPWLRLETEEHKAALLARYPALQGKLTDSATGNTMSGNAGEQARVAATSPSSLPTYRKNQVTYSRYWVRPVMYLLCDEATRAGLKENFPDGVKVTRVQDEIVDVEPERLDETWEYCKPGPSDGIYGQMLMKPHLQAQDIYNNLLNTAVETLERMVVWFLADPEVIDFDQLRDRRARPAEVVPAKPAVGQNLRGAIQEAPTSELSPQMTGFMESVIESVRDIVGVQKVLTGQDLGRKLTATEYDGMRNAALQQLTPVWDEIRRCWAGTYKNAVKQLAKYAPRFMKVPANGDNTSRLVDVTRAANDTWHFDVEETIPITPGQRADRLKSLVMETPQLAQSLGVLDPLNAKKNQDLLGLPDFKNTQLDAVEAVLKIIQKLLKEQPEQVPQTDLNTGQPAIGQDGQPVMAPQCSMQPPQGFDPLDPQLVVATIKAWAVTKAGIAAQDGNPEGYENVLLYGEAYQNVLNAQMAPPPAPGQPAPPQGTGQPEQQGPQAPPSMEPPPMDAPPLPQAA